MRVLLGTVALGVLLAGCADKDDQSVQYFNCGEMPVKITHKGADVTLHTEEADTLLIPQGEGEAITFKGQGNFTNLTYTPTAEGGVLDFNDRTIRDCSPVIWKENENITHFKAFGNEPGWTVEISPALVKVMRGTDGKTIAQARDADAPFKRNYSIKDGDVKVSIKATSKNEPCRDTMSGQYFAYKVTMKMDGETFVGCGDAEPKHITKTTPLTGALWLLEDIDGKGIIDRSRINLRINNRGFINTDTMCGRFAAPYKTEGTQFTIVEALEPINQRRCASEALSEQQVKYTDILRDVNHYAYQMDGGLVLFTKDGRTLRFRER